MSEPVDPRDELLDVVDAEDRVVGQARREDVYARGQLHRTVMVVVRSPRGEVLVHRRTATKLTAPSLYDMVIGGVVDAGESYDACAVRELAEEVGVSGAPPRRILRFRYDGDPEGRALPQWIAVYETTWDGPVVPQPSEVAWWSWLPEPELEGWLAAEPEAFCADSIDAWRRFVDAATGGAWDAPR
jgi:8-oxo-dGTP pyrophosphatase MutT (NUDIX family)